MAAAVGPNVHDKDMLKDDSHVKCISAWRVSYRTATHHFQRKRTENGRHTFQPTKRSSVNLLVLKSPLRTVASCPFVPDITRHTIAMMSLCKTFELQASVISEAHIFYDYQDDLLFWLSV